MNTYYLTLLSKDYYKNTQFERLPHELTEYIISKFIIIPERRNYFTSSLNEIRLKGTFSRINYIRNMLQYYKNNNSHNYYDIKFYNMCITFVKDPEYVIDVLNTCKCCEKHQIKRPVSLNSYISPFTMTYLSTSKNNCNCKCRSYSRVIYQIFSNCD